MSIQKVVVVGSGIMGSGIAHVSAAAGLRTTIVDVGQELVSRAEEKIRKGLEEAGQGGAARNVSSSTDLRSAMKDADFMIEAVPEKIEIKLKVFEDADQYAPDHAVLATNTSAQSITEIASATKHPQRVIGMHFFNPVPKMKLVEIVKGLETNQETLRSAVEISRLMGKEVVEVKESPGFVTSRINVLVGNEAFYMLQEGIASAEDIDKALKLGLNYPMGPFEMVDMVGLDTRLNVLRFLHQKLGEKFRPCPLLEQYVKAGRLGKKVGRGIYDYTAKKS